ncbi:MAG: thiamine-phosphate kinase [Deltaproteobacteria bacterium]|nr:MAG: thiamine-phosphate kinase [Deltaproteobacteria bacterium]
MSETLSDIGEFGLIDRIHEFLQKEGVSTPGLTLGIGDDTASFRPHAGYELLVTCDSMVEGRHYLPDHITPLGLGRRAMALNISDIGAMGGRPLYALVSLGLKAETLVTDVEAMYRGFIAELNPFGASIIGGNVTKSEHAMFVDITLIGEVEQGNIVRRSTAKAGDVILITGYPGEAAAGLYLLLHAQPTEDLSHHPLVRAFNTPSHRAREGEAVAQSGYATAMIDTSDGFLGDLGHICQESGVGAKLILEKLPIREELRQAAAQLGRDPYELLLQESDDYELIITCPGDKVDGIRSTVAALSDVPVTEVGRITDAADGIRLILPDGTQRAVTPAGWDHFSS